MLSVFNFYVNLVKGETFVSTNSKYNGCCGRGGGNAGHNGLRSIDAFLGPDYWRVRIDVGHPGIKELVQLYVLQNFPDEERRGWVELLLAAIAETIPLLVSGAPDAFMSEVARRFSPPKEEAAEDPAQP
jgi:peptidyl-tRNA hydrolase, PTH1 family